MTDYNGYVHCGEVFRSSILSNEKPYLFKCIQCQDILQFEAFLTHFEQNLCQLREITIKEEVLVDGCLSGCPEKDKNEDINRNRIDEIEISQVGCLNEGSLVFKKDEDVSNADEKGHVRYKIESSDAEVDAEQQEFETDVSLDDDLHLNDDKYDSEDSNVTDETEYLVKRNQGNEEESMCSREFVSNFIENHDNVMALIEAYKAQTTLWNRIISFRDKEQRQKYLEIVTKELNQQRNIHLHWKQVSTLIRHLRRNYRDDLKDSQKQKTTYRSLWFSKHMQFLEPFIEKNFLATLDPRLPSLLQEQIVQILKIYENLPHLWNTSLIEHRCKNKRCESEMEMIKRIEATLGYEIDCEALNKYLKNIHRYFSQEKRKRLNDEPLGNSGLYQHLVFLLDHVGPFRCSQCDFENHTIFYYKVHLSKHDGSMPFKCSQCGKEFKIRMSYDYHARSHLEDLKYVCQVCGRKFLTFQKLKSHMRTHTKGKPYCCEICGKSFRHTQSLKDHKQSHTNNYLHTCEMCFKGFYNKATLNQHLKSHTIVRDYVCKTCGKAFKSVHLLRRHEVTHSDVRKYVCTICSKSYKLGFQLTQHIRTQHERNLSDVKTADYICKICGKGFKTKQHLRFHEVTHSDVRKYVCTICRKSFKLGFKLTQHMRIHGRNQNDEKTTTSEDKMADTEIIVKDNLNEILYLHTCEMCSKGFYNKATLNRHLKSHTNLRDYICKTCGKAFKMARYLRSHEVTHSDVRKYVCSICSKSFKRSYYLCKHMRIHGRNLSDDKTTTTEDKMADTEIIVEDNINEIL